jgi:hypothetical protein
MAEKPVKIVLPKERFQIGKTPDGKPVWVEPKDLLPTEDEKCELKQNLLNSRERGAIQKLANAVFMNAARFAQDTFYHIAPNEIIAAHESNEMGKVAAWASTVRYEVIQDGLVTVIKVKGKQIRQLHAAVSPSCADLVKRRVREMISSRN